MKLKASNRLELAWTPNRIRKTGLKREFSDSLRDDMHVWLDYPKSVTKVSNYRGLSLFEVKQPDIRSYYATSRNSLFPIAALYVNKDGQRWHSDLVLVMSEYRGIGLGTALYTTAIETLGHLASSNSLSVGSSKLWQFLTKRYKGWFVIPPDESPTHKEMKVKIVGWKTAGEVYPVFKTQEGLEVSLDTLLKKDKGAASKGYYLVEK